jgi:hypothetical protein
MQTPLQTIPVQDLRNARFVERIAHGRPKTTDFANWSLQTDRRRRGATGFCPRSIDMKGPRRVKNRRMLAVSFSSSGSAKRPVTCFTARRSVCAGSIGKAPTTGLRRRIDPAMPTARRRPSFCPRATARPNKQCAIEPACDRLPASQSIQFGMLKASRGTLHNRFD